jgi:hypothetical protein
MTDTPQTLDDELGFDADHNDPRQYCQHGTWIGSWWGPDYLCGACESGISAAAYQFSSIQRSIRRWEDKLGWFARIADEQSRVLEGRDPTYCNYFRNIVVQLVLAKYDESAALLHEIALAKGQLVRFWLDHPDFDPTDDSQWGF